MHITNPIRLFSTSVFLFVISILLWAPGAGILNGQDNETLSGNYPPVNMSDFMWARQGQVHFHLEGYAQNFDPNVPNRIISSGGWGFMKTMQIDNAPDGTPQFVIIKGASGTVGKPIELYNLVGGKIFLVYEQMNWDNQEYREHRHPDGTLSFDWADDNAKPYEVRNYADANWTWHYCADPTKDWYQPFGPYAHFPTRVFDLTTEPLDQVETDLREAYAVDAGWLDFPNAFGHPEAHVLLVAIDYYWGPLEAPPEMQDDSLQQYDGSLLLARVVRHLRRETFEEFERQWQTHERYKYMALGLPDGTLIPVGMVGWCSFQHSDPNQPMVKQNDGILNVVVPENEPVEPKLACEP